MTTALALTTPPTLTPAPRLPLRSTFKMLFLRRKTLVQGLLEAHRGHGPIFEFKTPSGAPIVLGSHALVREVLDEKRFEKCISRPLEKLRPLAGDGLFTAYSDEPNWHTAHNILVPAFGMGAIKSYYPSMLQKAQALVTHWENKPAGTEVDVSDDMTRLTFDTIGLCGFGLDFESFQRKTPHPFVEAMTHSLTHTLHSLHRPGFLDPFFGAEIRRNDAMIALMEETVDAVIAQRRDSGERHDDLLDLMLYGQDSKTGERLSDLNIRRQVLTFLIAGHETTSGLLSFALHFMVSNPEVLQRARQEVDDVLGGDWPSFEDIGQLTYLKQILMESLRLWPTAAAFARAPLEDCVLGDKYAVAKGQELIVLVGALHRDPEVWGPNPDRFDPERFSPQGRKNRPATAFRPFGTGKRACIGRQFAMVEATLALAVILQRFDLSGDPDYTLQVVESLTLRPSGFGLQLQPRDLSTLQRRPSTAATTAPEPPARCPFHR